MKNITISRTTLFHIALEYLGDATLWQVIADVNAITDPYIHKMTILTIPNSKASSAVTDRP